MNFKAILEVIKNANSIVISAHTNPDGDAIGAMMWLWAIFVLTIKKVIPFY